MQKGSLTALLAATSFLYPALGGATIKLNNYSGGYQKTISGTDYHYIPVKKNTVCDGAVMRPNTTTVSIPINLDAAAADYTSVVFEISTDKSAKDITGQDNAASNSVAVYAEYVSGTNTPIPLVNADDPVNSQYNSLSTSNTPYYLNVPFSVDWTSSLTDTKVHVGLLLNQSPSFTGINALCQLATAASLCVPTKGSSTSVDIKIGFVSTYNNTGTPGFTSAVETPKTIKVGFEACPPGTDTTAGPLAINSGQFYAVPGDSRIRVVVPSVPLLTNGATISDSSGLHHTVVYTSPTASPTFLNSTISDFFDNTSGTFTVGNLTNETDYWFSIGYVNYAGFVSTGVGGTSSASLPDPQHGKPMAIAGFLDHSTCFVATAAYGTEFEPKLTILREFRDQILARSKTGLAFIRWYYSWSAGASTWLTQHDGYKTLVRVALVPAVEGARAALWLKDRLWIMAIILVLGTATVVFVTTRRERTI